ncbi:MAG: aminopeptidase N [Dehalococcoidia bacterium]
MTTPTAQTQHRDVLTQGEAEARAARVSNTAYELALDLTAKAETYRGSVTITFDLEGSGDLFLDHRGKTIHRLEVNGRVIDSPDWTGYRLTLPGDALQAKNTVRIEYENDYDHQGDGFHQFIDPEDGQEYLYTNFEPYESHRLFPGFDQPDIKATYALTVTAPSEWELIANYPETRREKLPDGREKVTFATTKPFSTYLFALVAGPYQAFREDHNGIPIGLFCRKSMAKFLDTEELFTMTRQGLDWYGEFFDFPYPFGKYDQVFVPEFNAGAMENVGCVTHNEYMVYRDPPTETQRRRRAETVLHEMAHMWFGDLVTMKWWNDLWLNESFATYMSYLCMDSATRFELGWQDFNASMKNWAYRQDQLVTTHPIAGQVADTDATFLNFDGITYGKGASVLKQLVAAIGIEGFREGMRKYMATHQYSNATLAQFMGALEQGSGRDLKEWSRLWLETPSLNTLAATWEADGDHITRVAIAQTAPADYPTLRPHRIDLGMLRQENGRFEVDVLPVEVNGAETEVPGAQGKPKPELVFPNHNDLAYTKIALDADSVAFVRENIERVEDPLLRQLLWSSLWSMVRDQQLKSMDYLALVREKIALEQNPELVESVLNNATAALGRYVPEDRRDAEAHTFFEAAWKSLKAAPKGDMQIVWARALIGSAINADDILLTGRLADGEESVEGLTVDQDMRWGIAGRFVGFGLAGAQGRVARELERDPSDRGQRAKLRCDISVPEAAVKAAAWDKFHTQEGYGSLYLTQAAMGGFNWHVQRDLLAPYVDRFFVRVKGVFKERDKEFATGYFGALYPSYRVERETVGRSEALLKEVADDVLLTRTLREAIDELERAVKCREFALTP